MVSWFEVPVLDIKRAAAFYETIFSIKITIQDFGGVQMGWFPSNENKSGAAGSLIQYKKAYKPSDIYGPLLYFYSDDVQVELDKILAAKGSIVQPKTMISEEIGYMAIFLDTEGNRIALKSKK
jgi:hypothetical protein